MNGKTTIQSKHADWFKSNIPASPTSFPPVVPFDDIIITINSVRLATSYRSSVIVDDSERSISVPSAIKPVHDSMFARAETISHGISAAISGARIIVCGVRIIISVTETVICGQLQNPTNEQFVDGSTEISISMPEMTICSAETPICALQIIISDAQAIISGRTLIIDGPYTVISGPHSIIYIRATTISVVATVIPATEIDLSDADTIISAFFTSFFAAQSVISAAEKTAGTVPAGLFPNNDQPIRR